MNRKQIISIIVAVIVIAIAAWLTNWFFSTVTITIKSDNAANIEVSSAGSITISGPSPLTTRVSKNADITVSYTGKEGYDEGKRYTESGDDDLVFSFEPYYSKSRLQTITMNESDAIRQSIVSHNSSVNQLYEIKDITTYHYGEWASAKLQWRGEYEQNSDTLLVTLNKVDNQWVVSDEPSIIINKAQSKTPVDILEAINKSVLN